MKSIALSLAANRKQASQKMRFCEAGCSQPTREGKPFCIDHIERQDYVQRLVERMKEKNLEEESVKTKGMGAVSPNSETVQEILRDLKVNGIVTIPKLAARIGVEQKALRGYIDYLVQSNLVCELKSSKNEPVLRLQDGSPPLIPTSQPELRKSKKPSARKPKRKSRRLTALTESSPT